MNHEVTGNQLRLAKLEIQARLRNGEHPNEIAKDYPHIIKTFAETEVDHRNAYGEEKA